MLREDRGEFILMGKQPLKPGSHDFFISHREQEVSQLTGVNAANCAADKRRDTERDERRRRRQAGRRSKRLRSVLSTPVCAREAEKKGKKERKKKKSVRVAPLASFFSPPPLFFSV